MNRQTNRGFIRIITAITISSLLLLAGVVIIASCNGSAASQSESQGTTSEARVSRNNLTGSSLDTSTNESTNEEHSTTDTASELVQTAAQSTAQTVASQPEASSSHEFRTFTILPEQSEARFVIHEELLGAAKTVVGRTNQITGSIAVDLSEYPNSQLSEIQIDARALETDNTFRNRTMRRSILKSNKEQFRYIFFHPTAIEGFPDEIKVGDTFHLQISGDLAIAGVTQPAQFAVTVTAASDVTLQGLATATLTRTQYNLQIPSVPNVANVGEEVLLQMDFLAKSEQ